MFKPQSANRIRIYFRLWSHHRVSAVPYSVSSAPEEKCPKSPKKFFDTPAEYAAARPVSEMPGPSAFQLCANMLLPSGKYYKAGLNQLLERLHREYGDVVKFPGLFGREPLIFLFDADQVEKVYRNEGQWPYRKGFEFFQEFREKCRPEIFQGRGGLLQEQGKDWQTTRTMVNPVMMQPKTVARYAGMVDTIAEDFIARIRSIRDDKREVPGDFGNEMNKWALESVAYIAMDQRLGLLTDTDPESAGQKLIQNVHDFFDLSYQMEAGPSLWKYYKTPGYHKLMNCLNSITDIIISYIDKSIAEAEKNALPPSGEESVLQKLLKIDKRVAIIMALDMLMAGVDTTSNTIVSLLYLLAMNPEKQAILRKEVLDKLPHKDSAFTAESLKNLPYLRACVKEAQRMKPVVVSTLRKADRDIILGGYQVPKEYQIVMAHFLMSNHNDNFGRCDEFLPERFLKSDPNEQIKSKQPFAYLPFGFGPRMCIGKRLAELEIETVTAKLIRNFAVEWHHPPLEYGGNTFMNQPTGDIKFRFVDVTE